MKLRLALATLLMASAAASAAYADKLDDIISAGKLRCAVVLDFPPMGSRDASKNPFGFDVDYCNDLAKALGVTTEIVETPFPERIPALMSGRVDVGVAATSDTLGSMERRSSRSTRPIPGREDTSSPTPGRTSSMRPICLS